MTSVSLPKFVIVRGRLQTNFGSDQDTSKLMFLVWFSDLKFAYELAANDAANFKSTTLGWHRIGPRTAAFFATRYRINGGTQPIVVASFLR